MEPISDTSRTFENLRGRSRRIRERKRISIRRWFLALVFVGLGAASAVSLVQMVIGAAPLPKAVWTCIASIGGSLIGGVLGFMYQYATLFLKPIAVLRRRESCPHEAAWHSGIVMAVFMSSTLANDAQGRVTLPHIAVGVLGAVIGLLIWWCLDKVLPVGVNSKSG